jgi:hypothetical protein
MRAHLDFSAATRKALANRGIRVIGSQAAPAYDGDTSFSGRVYQIVKDDCSMMRNRAQIMELAQ